MVFKGLFVLLAFNAGVSAIWGWIVCKDFWLHEFKLCRYGSKPDCPEKMKVTYTLYQRNLMEGRVIERNDLPNWGLTKQRTIFVVHGFRSNCKNRWILDMKKKLLAKLDVNVILVDWRKGADKLVFLYYKAARNVQTVGYSIALMMDALKRKGILYSSMWCIGHSLGGHTCGFAGRNINNGNGMKIGRITGLDPAGPCFRNEPDLCSLKKDDAIFVDVIHTHGGNFGIHKLGKLAPMGTLDFYPNAGQKQPECGGLYDQNTNMSSMTQKCPGKDETLPCGANEDAYGGMTCSHARAHVYFRNSINASACSFKATQRCTDHKNIPGSCYKVDYTVGMGYNADHSHSGLYYLDVKPLGPECYTQNGVGNKTPSMYLFLWVTIGILNIIL